MRNLFRGALLACGISLALPAAADVFINEIHYDTPGSTDANETVEVVATGGEDLANYRIQLYNGNGGAPYGTVVTLPSGATVTCGSAVRIATYNFTANGGQIQNGSPDGIALIGPGDAVIQFLSYEGQMTAVGGFADGVVSQDIGVAEDNAGNLGESLQLSGSSGTTYADFTWQGEATATFGACNNGQTFGTPVDNPPQLTASTPANGASGVAVGSPITLTFSEAVTTTDPWFVLDCGAGAVAGTLSGSGNTRSFDPTADLPFNTSCTVTLTAANIVDTDGSLDTLTGATGFSFTTAADLAPSVTSVSPIDGATGVAIAANLTVTFSEAVTPTLPNWLTLSCAGSGVHTVTISGGPTIWTINPDSDFGFSELCTATIAATNVEDQDGTPDPMAAPKSWTFTTGADLAPTVASSYPADGATNIAIATNLSVTFSEAVTVSPGAFSLACGANPHTLVVSTLDQTTYILDPDSNFATNVSCVLTITASQVLDIDGTPTPMDIDAAIDFMTTAGVSGYYERVDTTSCRALRATLHGVIDDHHSVSYDPVAGPDNDTWDLLEPADVDPLDPTKILDVYENKKYERVTDRASSVCTGRYNREHTWPKSLGFPSETGDMGLPNAPHTDGHMLYLSNCEYNSHRGNNPYRTCATPGSCNADPTQLNHGEGGVGINNLYTGSFYDTWPKRRGDVARAVLYMDFRYEGGRHSKTGQLEPDLVLTYGSDAGTPGSLDTLLAWHDADPPSMPASTAPLDNIELLRNDTIELIQHNRNPLIDHPEWAPIIFAQPCNGPAVVAVDDDFAIAQDTTLNASAPGVLRDDHNGVNKNGEGLTASLAIQAQHGTATITNGATGAFTYVPDAGYCGTDQFTYQVTNGSVVDQGIAHIEVTGANCTITPPDDIFDDSFETSAP